MKVKIVRRENVKPSSPTPSYLKTITLPFVDQLTTFGFHIPCVFVYTKFDKTPEFDINTLKNSLAKTLTHFYPFAGRCMDASTVRCNDEGATFIVADVTNCSLKDVLDSPRKFNLLAELLPPPDSIPNGPGPTEISDFVPIVLQINVFPCGGVVMGCYLYHKLMDAATLVTFFKGWSAIATECSKDLVRPNFEATLKAFPSCGPLLVESVAATRGKQMMQLRPPHPPVSLVSKTFVFSNAILTELKAKAVSLAVLKPTRFETLAGFIAQHALAAAKASLGKDNVATPGLVRMTVNMRPRMTPPLPRESMGNVITNAVAYLEKQDGLPSFVEDIHNAFSRVNEKIKGFEEEGGAEAFVSDMCVESSPWLKPGEYFITSWCRLGLLETDLGFGKPKWVAPIGQIFQAHRNRICFLDYSGPKGEGIEVWLILEENEMEILESNSDFLAFASIN